MATQAKGDLTSGTIISWFQPYQYCIVHYPGIRNPLSMDCQTEELFSDSTRIAQNHPLSPCHDYIDTYPTYTYSFPQYSHYQNR